MSTNALRIPTREMLPTVIGGAAGILAFYVAGLETRWAVATGLAISGLVVAAAFPGATPLYLSLLVLSLQANLCLTFFPEAASRWVGRSGPAGLEIYLTPLIALAVVASDYPRMRKARVRFQWDGPLAGPSLWIAATMLVSVMFSSERRTGLFALLLFGQGYLIYRVAANVIRTQRAVRILAMMLLVTLIIQSTVYFIQYATGMTFTLTGEVSTATGLLARHGGTVSTHPSAFAEFINLLFPIALALYLGGPAGIWHTVSGISAAFGGLAILISFTRAAWIGCALAVCVVVFTSAVRRRIRLGGVVQATLGVLVATAIFAVPIAGVFGKNHEEDYDERVALQEMATRVIVAHPIVGVGIGAYSAEFRHYLTSDLEDKWQFVVHNAYLLRAAETGLPGMVAMLLWFAAALRLARRCSKLESDLGSRIGLGALAGLLAVMFQFWFDTANAFPVHATLWFVLGLIDALIRLEAPRPVAR